MNKEIRKSVTVQEYIKQKALKYLGLITLDINPRAREEQLTFVNNENDVKKIKLKEYNVWYGGDSDDIMNFYTKNDMIDFNTDPIYFRNKKSYFWSVSSTEEDVKRTHSGQPRNIVDTLVNIVGLPQIKANQDEITKRLQEILDDNDFNRMFLQEQLPFTLVEGWGCYKINYDLDLTDNPIVMYYRADAVDFIMQSKRLVAIIFQDYYEDKDGNNYLLFETRRKEKDKLVIEKDLFRMDKSDVLTPCELTDLPQLRDVEPIIEINNYNKFLAVPCIIYKDNNEELPGRSIYTGKIDMFDDLDQCHSQAANTVRRSTVQEYFNSNYLEKDQMTGLPIQPHSFDRKYVMFNGGADANGSTTGQEAVHVVQPALNFNQYDAEEQNILVHMIAGIMSPATLGIDIAKKDNAEAQREKEKVTIFTRNTIIYESCKMLSKLANELLCCWELMHKKEITVQDYDITVKFDEFADSSFENKLDVLINAFNSGIMTPEMFIDQLYKDSLSESDKAVQVEYIKKQQSGQAGVDEEQQDMLGQLGAMLGGANNNPTVQGMNGKQVEFAE